MFALKHTVSTFVELMQYLFEGLQMSYVLTGKFQNTTTTTTTTKVLIIVTLHKVTGAIYISD